MGIQPSKAYSSAQNKHGKKYFQKSGLKSRIRISRSRLTSLNTEAKKY